MSRIGKLPISLPPSVKVSSAAGVVSVEGPKGKLQYPLPANTKVEVADGTLRVLREGEELASIPLRSHGNGRSRWGVGWFHSKPQ